MSGKLLPTLLAATLASFAFLSGSSFDSPNGSQAQLQRPAPAKQKRYVDKQESEKIAAGLRKAYEAIDKEDYKAGAEILKTVYAINPEDDLIINYIWESYAMLGDDASLLLWLRRLVAVSPCFFHYPENRPSIVKSREYQKLAQIAAKGIRPHASEVAFTLAEKDLIPEGIAYDPVDQVFFLSSLHKRKIVRVRPRTANQPAVVEDFTSQGQDGLYSTLGMKVDAKRRVLWVCSSAEGFMTGYSEADAGKAALFKYDLNTRKLIRKYEIGPKPSHLLNDLALNAEGDVFITDTASGEIFTVLHDKDVLEVFIPAGRFTGGPNGIAVSSEGGKLFISVMPLGVYVVDVKTKLISRLPQNVGISPSGSDGLYFYQNSLIGIINIVSERAGRVARFYLDDSGESITRGAVLDCNHPVYQRPTTGVVVGDSLFYIANSQYGSFDDKGIFPRTKLHKVVVMKLKL
jgi:sugar lactone lactonase YvrE